MNKLRYTIQDLVEDPSFARWAKGKAAEKEGCRWNEWVEASERNRRMALHAQKIVSGISFKTSSFTEHRDDDWRSVERKLSGLQARKIETSRSRRNKNPKKDTKAALFKVAALLLITLVAGLATHSVNQYQRSDIHQEVETHTITTDFSEKRKIALSDGSEIILAADSRMTYKDDWLDQPVKQVRLSRGEAFFSIVPGQDRSHPSFEVETEDGTTAVWGTEFSVSTYGDGTQVVLLDGEVAVAADSDNQLNTPVRLAPGEKATWKRNQKDITRTNVNPQVYTSWTSEQLYFDHTPLSHLVSRIERTYGMEVLIKDPALMDTELSGSIDFRSLDALIKAVSEVLEIQIRRVDNQVVIG